MGWTWRVDIERTVPRENGSGWTWWTCAPPLRVARGRAYGAPRTLSLSLFIFPYKGRKDVHHVHPGGKLPRRERFYVHPPCPPYVHLEPKLASGMYTQSLFPLPNAPSRIHPPGVPPPAPPPRPSSMCPRRPRMRQEASTTPTRGAAALRRRRAVKPARSAAERGPRAPSQVRPPRGTVVTCGGIDRQVRTASCNQRVFTEGR